ncbi:MAG TPA: endolytic transglycosylase MltG [Solirubrobacteraceae bacterium]|nr:endolytic transglycosylase MltG [Solirubrobacteraceae bacterium]
MSAGERTAAERERARAERSQRRTPASGGRPRRGPQIAGAALALALLAIAAGLGIARLEHRAKPVKTVAAPIVVKVLVPEGETRLQMAARAHTAGLTGSYLAAAKRSPALDPARYGAPAGTPNLEGFLFPATYELYSGAPAAQLVREQLAAFSERFGRHQIERARALHLTPYELLIVASILEREAQLSSDRPKVAAVVYNRLRLHMPLGVDATIRYVLHDYSSPLTAAQLALVSPYNTRIHLGLPPTPISNPGMAAIEAAAHPAHVPYLYYVDAPDGCGDLVFSKSFAQFERDAAAYREALRANNGNVPACHAKR